MNRPAVRVASALLAFAVAGFVLVVTAAGLLGLVVTLVTAQPIGQGRTVAATITAAGVGLLLLAHVLDPRAVPSAITRARAVSSDLAAVVASRGTVANTTTNPARLSDLLPGTLAEIARRTGRAVPESVAAQPPAVSPAAAAGVPVSRPDSDAA